MESAFGVVPEKALLDNARALILSYDVASREVVMNPKLHPFVRHWGFQLKACAHYRPRTKGKDECGVGYVKGNAIAGRAFHPDQSHVPPPAPVQMASRRSVRFCIVPRSYPHI